jgi:hypothetical protein
MPNAPRPVFHADAAAAPLGTDDEAAGTPAEAVNTVLRDEVRGPALKQDSEPAFWPGAAFIIAGGVLIGYAAWLSLP